MASIRTRITALYALALAGTIAVSSIVLWIERRNAATNDLFDRATAIADLGARIVGQAGPSDIQQPIVGLRAYPDSTVNTVRQFSTRFMTLLDVLPDYVVVQSVVQLPNQLGEDRRIIYQSKRVARLGPVDFQRFTREAFPETRLLNLDRLTRVTLDSDVVLFSRPVNIARTDGVLKVIAGVSMKPLDIAMSQVLEVVLIAGPLILAVSVATAWGIGGRFVHLERMVEDVEAITDGLSLHRRIPVEDEGDEIWRLGANLNAMLGRLEHSFAALRRFTADASHELKTPLTVLRADIERAMSVPTASTEQLVALEEALAETTRMAGLVESLLTLARADEGRFDLHREPVPLEPLVRDVAETAQILGEAQGLTVTLARIEPVTVMGDAVRLRQLFLNLVENAVKYSSPGGNVEVGLDRTDRAAVFRVKDSGIGIAGADLPFIFERFWRVDRARSRGERAGAGLGLAISQWIAQAHGGSINVSSRMGHGSTFSVSIPSAADAIKA